jgi:predicted dehydrogenase
VAVNFEQLKLLRDHFANRNVPVLVSFPLRLTPIVQRVKEIVAADQIGTIEHIIAVNDVPYGAVYFNDWYRDYDIVGGLFLQKATHDFDYLADLVGQRVSWVGAMNSRRVYGGHQPYDLKCKDCQLQKTCLESPFNLYYQRYEGKAVQQTDWRCCVWSQGLKNEDVGNCLLEYANGVQASYTQNFFARNQAARRGARLYGYKGTIDFDWYRDEINIYYHQSPRVETIKFTGAIGHFGGDHELCHDWLGMLRGEMSSRAPLQAGIGSVLTCLWARESAEKRIFCEVKWP